MFIEISITLLFIYLISRYIIRLKFLNPSTKIKFIILEGNIGAGKSTLLDIISKSIPKVYIIQEPIYKWKKGGLFEIYYKDRKRYGYLFQTYVLTTRIKAILRGINTVYNNPDKYDTIMIERSGLADISCFVEIMHMYQEINDIEYKAILKIYKYCFEKYSLFDSNSHKFITKMIMLLTDPEVCKKRIDSRARNGESGIKLKYLQDLDEYHRKNLINDYKSRGFDTGDIFTINGNTDYINIKKNKNILIQKIQEFI